jgi:hypothetical protein
MIVRTSGVDVSGMGVLVGIGTGVRVVVGSKVNVGWIFVAVGLGVAHPPRKSIQGRNTKIITAIRDVEDLLLTSLAPGTIFSLYNFLFLLPHHQFIR